MSESNAIERRPVALGSPMVDLDSAFRLAKNLAVADVMPKDLRKKPSDVLAIMLYGQDLGMTPMQSIQGIYVVKGKPQLSSTTWVALARRAGHKVRIVESTDERCTVEITRADDPEHPHRETYTLDMAVKAGLCRLGDDGKAHARTSGGDKLPWEAYTALMLRNRAISNAGKFACPEVALGFAIEGDYDYVPDAVTVDAVEVTPPAHHGETVAAKVTQAHLNDEISQLAAEFDFAETKVESEDEPVEPEPAADYVCERCGAVGEHFEDECPIAGES